MVPTVKIAVTLSDGTLTILSFIIMSRSPTLPIGAKWVNDGSGRWMREPSDATIEAELAKAFPLFNTFGQRQPQPVRWQVVSDAEIPQDRTYRNAWRHDGKRIHHDIEHARRIHLDHVRQARLEQLGRLDRDWMKATGQGQVETAAAIEAQRQVLRDLPMTLPVQQAATVDDLKALWPKDLPR